MVKTWNILFIDKIPTPVFGPAFFFFNHVPLDPKSMKSEGFNHYKYGL